ncbi:sigma-70 family RNA polymerase sigma factor [Ruminococcus sp.]|uniref:sigma-70 family RNA polymerase sigma factor n=1 Tax=Ruminococcus sp. TaxID=41978 RepID=UPI00388ED68C
MDRNELIEQNLRLVHACARRFRDKGVEYDDLYAAGCLGLTKAADRFDRSRGFRFSTYAVPVILGEIRQLFRSGGSVKVSRSLQELSLRAREVCERYRACHESEITVAELARQLGVDSAGAVLALNALRAPLSLSGDDEGEAIEVPVPSPEDVLTDRLALRQVIDSLAEEDRSLIILRYFRRLTQQQTASTLGTSQVQVSRREKKILLRMRGMLC